jgi:membrane protein DedA with SNARE-associated domain/membrane-associated phospholipid phosphatase
MKPAWFVAAGAVLVLLIWRWRKWGWLARAAAALVIAAAIVYGTGQVELPNLEELVIEAGQTLGQWTYLLAGGLAFLETAAFMSFIAPGEVTLVLAGVIAGQGEINILVLLGIVWVAAVLGDCVSYLLGRRLGRAFVLRHGPRVKITRERLETVERFYEEHGGKMVVIGRFVGVLRALGPFIAGASKMPFGKFLPYDVVGAVAWGSAFVMLGYIFWQSFDQLTKVAGTGGLALGTLIVVVGGAWMLIRYLKVPENREKTREVIDDLADRPALRPVARAGAAVYRTVLRPVGNRLGAPSRFVARRFTPGDLGLELTVLVLIAIAGLYAFGLMLWVIGSDPVPAMDADALDTASELAGGVGEVIARILNIVGSLPVVIIVVLAVAAFAVRAGRVPEAVALVAGLVVTEAAVDIVKVIEDRPRPGDALVDTVSASFPSGHAAKSLAFVAVAVVIAEQVRRREIQVALIVAAVVLAAAIGLSRLTVRAHYLSDVIGGWGLGAAGFALAGIAVLVFVHARHPAGRMRHNPTSTATTSPERAVESDG